MQQVGQIWEVKKYIYLDEILKWKKKNFFFFFLVKSFHIYVNKKILGKNACAKNSFLFFFF